MNEENIEEKYRSIVSKSIEELEPGDLIDVSYVKQSAEEEEDKELVEEMEEIERKYYGEELLQFIKRNDEQLGRIQKRLFTLGEARERWEEFLERTEEWPHRCRAADEAVIKTATYRFTEKTHFV